MSPRLEVQNEAYNVVGAMACQRTDLEAESLLNQAEDAMRRELSKVFSRQARALAEGDLVLASALNRVGRTLLGHIDELDEAQDEDPMVSAFGHNREAAESGRRIIRYSEVGPSAL